MSQAKDISRGDWIKDGRHSGKVTRVREEGGMVLIEWERGTASGVLGRVPKAEVRRVFKPKPRWSW